MLDEGREAGTVLKNAGSISTHPGIPGGQGAIVGEGVACWWGLCALGTHAGGGSARVIQWKESFAFKNSEQGGVGRLLNCRAPG